MTHEVPFDGWLSQNDDALGRAMCGAMIRKTDSAGRRPPTCPTCAAIRTQDQAALDALVAETEAQAFKSIPFTQWLRPDGRRKAVVLDRPPAIARLADDLIADGFHFDIEVIGLNVSMTVEGTKVNTPLAHEVTGNGPQIYAAVDRLVQTAHDAWAALPKELA